MVAKELDTLHNKSLHGCELFDDPTEVAQESELFLTGPSVPARSHWLGYAMIVTMRLVARESGKQALFSK